VKLLLREKNIDKNKCDRYGVNAFWIAAFYGQVEVLYLKVLNHIEYESPS
jgi:hypothetical protein